MMRAASMSRQHRRTRDDESIGKALPQMSNVGSDKRCDDNGQEVAREYATEKKWRWWLAMADKNFQ
jgi:hypothetical protein